MNSLRKFTCNISLGGCGRTTSEPRGMNGFRGFAGGNVPRDIEIEYVDLCEKCGNKKLKEQKLLTRVTGAASAGLLTNDELKIFGQWGKISSFEKRIFIEKLQNRQLEARKKQKIKYMKKLGVKKINV